MSVQLLPAAITPADFALLSRVIRTVARTHRLKPEDAEDFAQTVHLKLLERRYDVFSSFEGRSSLATFLSVVVTRLLLDWRNSTQGKWRPSAAARRLGPDAVTLERLIHRDGMTEQEAVATIAASRQPQRETPAHSELRATVARLPVRFRRSFVRNADPESLGRVEFTDPVVESDERRARQARHRALRRACASLSPDDQRLIRLRFYRALTVQAIGRQLQTDPKPLYRRLERSLATLRQSIESSGEKTAAASAAPEWR